jgi:hypothetical protein
MLNSIGYYPIKVIYLNKNWKKILVDKGLDIKNPVIINNYLIYDLIETVWSIKKIYDIKKEDIIWEVLAWVFILNNKYIYWCMQAWLTNWDVSLYNLSTNEFIDLSKNWNVDYCISPDKIKDSVLKYKIDGIQYEYKIKN